MTNYFGVHSVGDSLITFLRDTYPEPLRTAYPCEFKLISSGELDQSDDMGTAVTLYLYRVDIDRSMRNAPDAQRPGARPYPLSLCLYYLFIIWSNVPLIESTIAAWIMSQIHQHP